MELIKGETYVITDRKYLGESIIYLHEKMSDNDRGQGFYISDFMIKSWKFYNSTPFLTGRDIRLASYKEKYWLNECIKIRAIIPYDQIIFNKIHELW